MSNSISSRGNVLQNEKRFHLQNEELEERNTKLIEELELLMKKKKYVLIDSSEELPKINTANITSANFEPSSHNGISKKSKHIDENIGNIKKKNDVLQKEVDLLTKNIKKKYEEQRAIEIESDRMVNECNLWNGKAKNSRMKLQALDKRVSELSRKLEDGEMEGQNLKKEKCTLDKKSCDVAPHSDPAIINQLKEEKERLKTELRSCKTREPALLQNFRAEKETNRARILQLERERSEVIKIFKKQSLLIDNLVKQKEQIEAIKATEMTESDCRTFLNENEV